MKHRLVYEARCVVEAEYLTVYLEGVRLMFPVLTDKVNLTSPIRLLLEYEVIEGKPYAEA